MKSDPLFSHLLKDYDIFLFDVYGVIHNGQDLTPSTVHVLKELNGHQKPIGLISNSPLSTLALREKLSKMGLPPYYQILSTAGEVTHKYLKRHKDPIHARLGSHCYFIGEPHEVDILLDTPYSRVDSLDQADFMVITSTDEWHKNPEDYQELLEEALDLFLPLVCANPDRYQINNGHLELRAGSVAHLYETMGGQVIPHGKPHRDIFEEVFQHYPHISPSRILMVGDSLMTDIQASNNLGFDSVLLLGPMFTQETTIDFNAPYEKIVHHLEKFRYTPTYVTSHLQWD